MKLVLNAAFLLSVLVVWCVLPAAAYLVADRAAFGGWGTALLVGAGAVLAFPLTFAYLMVLGVFVGLSEFRRGLRGECGPNCGPNCSPN